MNRRTLNDALDFIVSITEQTRPSKSKLTFHGGEPLMAGLRTLTWALDGLEERFGRGGTKLAIQSNLWLLDDAYCALFRDHGVEVGTSLDGPQDITDAQRGFGYFKRTMAAVRLAQRHGIDVGCIATFTPASLTRWREVFEFFLSEGLSFSIHSAVPSLDQAQDFALSPAAYGSLLHEMLDAYVEHRREIRIPTLDHLCQGVSGGDGKVCTFRDCLGMFLAIDPHGDIFACQRFAGRPEYRLGTLGDRPTLDSLLSSPIGRRFSEREARVRGECSNCRHQAYCRGGCAYNAWAVGGEHRIRDPYCEAYRNVMDYIQERLLDEMATEENIAAVAESPWDGRGNALLKKGPLIELAREGQHPSQKTRTARRIVAAVELAQGPDLPSVAARLVRWGIAPNQKTCETALENLGKSLTEPTGRLNNLYAHLTFGCQLSCTHCYARADGGGRSNAEMPIASVKSLIWQANKSGFRQVIITGGEPLIHSERSLLLDTLRAIRAQVHPMNLVLRTNLTMLLDDTTLQRIARAFNQVVVSVDGSETTHDARRGQGSYTALIENLQRYQRATRCITGAGELSLACVMGAKDIQGDPGQSVRTLADQLGVRRTRFRPILPLGRAADWDAPPMSEALGAHGDPIEFIEYGFQPTSHCGLGLNLYVEPNGQSFPCYAYHRSHALLGNVFEKDLQSILDSPAFRDLSRHTVDTNPKCRECKYRYLCGGACRAWGGEATQYDLDAPPPECGGLYFRAQQIYHTAAQYIDIRLEEVDL